MGYLSSIMGILNVTARKVSDSIRNRNFYFPGGNSRWGCALGSPYPHSTEKCRFPHLFLDLHWPLGSKFCHHYVD